MIYLPRITRSHLAVALAALLIGCETMLEIEPSEHEPLLVVHSVFSPDQVRWEVQVQRTTLLNEGMDPFGAFVSNATVEILHEGKRVASLAHDRRGRYTGSGPSPEAGQAYTLRVKAPGFETVTATSRVPEKVALEATFADSMGTITDRSGAHPLSAFEVRFSDPDGRVDYYQLSVMLKNGRVSRWEFYSDHPALPHGSLRDVIRSDGVDRPAYVDAPFTDAAFAGGRFDATLEFERRLAHAYWVRLTHLSKDYFRHKRSVALREEGEGNPFAEPVILYSNVEGGAGVFAGYVVQETAPVVLAEITPELVSGSYTASQFSLLRDRPLDILGAGGHLEMILRSDGRVGGHLLIPAEASPTGRHMEADLSGTFVVDEGAIVFSMDRNTFIGQVQWYYDGESLRPLPSPDAWNFSVDLEREP